MRAKCGFAHLCALHARVNASQAKRWNRTHATTHLKQWKGFRGEKSKRAMSGRRNLVTSNAREKSCYFSFFFRKPPAKNIPKNERGRSGKKSKRAMNGHPILVTGSAGERYLHFLSFSPKPVPKNATQKMKVDVVAREVTG